MICLLSPAHLVALSAFQLYALLLFVAPGFAAIPLVAFVLISFLAPLVPSASYYLPVVSKGPKKGRAIALTFDDGPSPEVTRPLLDLLDKHAVPATFFVTGVNAKRYPELIRAILERGHTLGNHSFNHSPFLMLKGATTLRREVESAQSLFHEFGVVPLAFRPPVGVTSPSLWKILNDLGMFCLTFSCRIGDMGNRRIRNMAARLLAKVRPGDIVLLHDVPPPRGDVAYLLAEFDSILTGLKQQGLEIQPLARLIDKDIMRPADSEKGTNSIERFYDGFAAAYDEEQADSAVSLSRSTELDLFSARLPDYFGPHDRVLEIGAGTGIFTTVIAQHCREVDAIDISGKMLVLLEAKCRKEGIANIRTRVGNVETMALEGQYDIACAFSSLAYLTDLPAFFRKLAPHIKRGGTVYFITARTSLFRFATQIGNAMRQGLWLKAYRRGEIHAMLSEAGFEPVSIDAHLLKCLISRGMIFEVIARKRGVAQTANEEIAA